MPRKRRYAVRKYRSLIFPVIAVLLIIVMISLIFRSCGKNRADSGNDDKANDTNYDTNAENTNSPADSNDGFFYIPVEKDSDSSEKQINPPPTSLSEDELNAAVLKVTQDLGAEYIEKFYFLCDSPIYGLKTLGMLSGGTKTDRVISGISSSFSLLFGGDAQIYDSETSGMVSVSEKIKKVKPEYLLVSVGADDISSHRGITYADFKEAYSALLIALKKASPKTTVICLPILPGSSGEGISIYDAENYNKYILEAAAECGAYYIDISSAFASSGGYLRIDCDGGSSRLNSTGVKRLLELLRSYTISE